MSARAQGERSFGWPRLLAGVAFAGGVGWVVDAATLWFLDRRVGVPTAVAAAIGFLSSAVVNFLINRRVFHARGPALTHTARYASLLVANLCVVTVCVPALDTAFSNTLGNESAALLSAKIVVTAALLPVNTIIYRNWVFAQRTEEGHAVDDTTEAPHCND